MGEARAYAVCVLLFALGSVQVGSGLLGLFDMVGRPELGVPLAIAMGKLTFGLLLFPAGGYVAKLRKRGLILAVVALSGVVAIYFGPLLVGDRPPLAVGSVLYALVLMVYLFLHEDAFGERPERTLSEDTNTHEFIR